MSCLRRHEAASKLGIDERTLSRYETLNPRDAVKQEDPMLIASAIRLYDDASIGVVYLSGHPVVIEMAGRFFAKIVGAVPDTTSPTPNSKNICQQCQFITFEHPRQQNFPTGA